MCQAAACRIIVNEITEQSVLSIKVTLPCCNDRDRSCNVRQSHSPVKLEPPEARSLGGPWWQCFLFFVVCCVLLCVREVVGSLGCPPLAHTLSTTYRTMVSYYVCLGISIVELDTYTILVKYLVRENGRREKNDKSVVCVVCCKKCYLLITIFPTANMRCTYEGIGICVDD